MSRHLSGHRYACTLGSHSTRMSVSIATNTRRVHLCSGSVFVQYLEKCFFRKLCTNTSYIEGINSLSTTASYLTGIIKFGPDYQRLCEKIIASTAEFFITKDQTRNDYTLQIAVRLGNEHRIPPVPSDQRGTLTILPAAYLWRFPLFHPTRSRRQSYTCAYLLATQGIYSGNRLTVYGLEIVITH